MIEIDFQFPNWAKKIQKAEQEISLFIAAQLQFNRGMIFDKEGNYNGRARWKDLVFRNGQILSKRGTLRKSIAPLNPRGRPGPSGIVRFAGDVITIGTTMGYARMMNDGTTKMPGGVLKAVRAKALKIPIPQGASAGEGAKDIQALGQQRKINRLHRALRENLEKRRTKAAVKQHDSIIRQIANAAEKMGKGEGSEKFIFRKSVKIPARPFDDWTQEDAQELEAALTAKITEILNRE